MVINKKIPAFLNDKQINQILDMVEFDKNTCEFSFNVNKLKKNGLIYAAIDDNNLNCEDGEISKLVNLTKDNILYFLCLDIESLKKQGIMNNSSLYLFDNTEQDWENILSPFNEYTLWTSAIFDIDFNIFIIKPWSVGYNFLISGKEDIIRKICSGKDWLINDKYPIYPV